MSRALKIRLILRHAQTARNLAARKALRAEPRKRAWMTRRGGA